MNVQDYTLWLTDRLQRGLITGREARGLLDERKAAQSQCAIDRDERAKFCKEVDRLCTRTRQTHPTIVGLFGRDELQSVLSYVAGDRIDSRILDHVSRVVRVVHATGAERKYRIARAEFDENMSLRVKFYPLPEYVGLTQSNPFELTDLEAITHLLVQVVYDQEGG